ncbi:MAG: F0F1 ATP synthase subunit epsilon [Rubellimicrobium sp.]|nr:F0F1 ATP synthase subunit epsilon [Rubellimicrobium sp.]
MADTVQFDLVAPERRLASVVAREVQIPGADGDMTAMAGHAPTITTLRPGILRVTHAGGTDEYLVSGGFADIGAGSISVLAEEALPRAEVSAAVIERLLAGIRSGTPGDPSTKAAADLLAAGEAIGISLRA